MTSEKIEAEPRDKWGNPQPRCTRCQIQKPSCEFNRMPSGKRRYYCKDCELGPYVHTKTCEGCHKTLPRDDNFRRRPARGWQQKCKDCLPEFEEQVACKRCNKMVPREEYARDRSGSRKPYCPTCWRGVAQERKCASCGQVKNLRGCFPLYGLKGSGGAKRGLSCNDCVKRYHGRRKGVPKWSEQGCAQCGHKFISYLSRFNVDRIKYCSKTCRAAAANTKTHSECKRCLKTKELKHFGLTPSRHIRGTCNACAKLAQSGGFSISKHRLPVVQMCAFLRHRGRKVGVTEIATEAELAARLAEGCGVCGTDLYTFIPRDPQKRYTGVNLIGACRLCRDRSARLGVQELVLYALQVSQGPLARQLELASPAAAAKPPMNARATQKQQRRKRKEKRWEHPLNPASAPINETFEEKLARVAAVAAARKHATKRNRGTSAAGEPDDDAW